MNFQQEEEHEQIIPTSVTSKLPLSYSSLSDFTIGECIGTGAFAKVYACYHSISNEKFALKAMCKSEVVRSQQVQHVLNEKNILLRMCHPNIIRAYGTFNDNDNIYILLEYVPGGELLSRLREAGCFSEKLTMFYAANIIIGLEYLHSHGIVFRDLKPENVLVCDNGYLKIVDFGFATKIVLKTWSICGTPDYIAPEIIQTVGHSFEADWWSLGVLIFEMLTGIPPFHAKTNQMIYDNILYAQIAYPRHMSFQAQDLVCKLLVRNPSERLGHTNGAFDVKSHMCFQGTDFDQIFDQTAGSMT
mmetsp:Transcript_29336/g.40532  ORF Transcript_29336/g.40532 Transcript_29336/m.40532 type:complete len:302 (+) Transcript_29336:219-1124(+)|eukprot:CAMPEP_0196579296 /NCGR_PEP_ID=MMETSP1081-20130531/19841_1 /TAXON_ID=36882 /ORGANISM="Pyramimonas amylifera, Strain CCMP720" /LENGTH=301 /DNA_ID=CAMNT_0041898829 /DNA_START=209 /DNA_END=1114 /DNA_ORIENTATION=+